ncbi:uncharacterized protein ACR2FA_000665 [Aphomia sociella]
MSSSIIDERNCTLRSPIRLPSLANMGIHLQWQAKTKYGPQLAVALLYLAMAATMNIVTAINVSKDDNKIEFCANLDCIEESKDNTCGIRVFGDGFQLRLFVNVCELLKYGCQVEDEKAYGLINIEYCQHALNNTNTNEIILNNKKILEDNEIKSNTKANCLEHDCSPEKNSTYFIIDGSLINYNNDINNTIDNFFAATHVFDLPVKEVPPNDLNTNTRRMLLNRFGPQKVFKPWITIPKNISDDHYHKPTLSSCYHTCPKKCPETYAPVCGVPGIVAREPTLMFQNHCFMDIAQCKMFWEDKSDTAQSSSYIESSFLFCLGDEMNGLYRFLPLVRTLQHMGRLKKRGHFRYKLKNLRFFNNLLSREPKLMG